MEKLIVADILSGSKNGHSEGHYFTVATNYVNMLGKQFDVYVAGGPVYYNYFNRMIKLKYDSKHNGNKFLNKMKAIYNGFELLRKVKDSTVIFQCSAVLTIFFCLALYPTKAKVFLIQYDTVSVNSKFKKYLYNLAKKRIKGIICPGNEIGESYELPHCVVPDYIYSDVKHKLPDISNVEIAYDFGMYGMQTKGKGVLEVAKFFVGTGYKVMIAGQPGSLAEDKEMVEELRTLCSENSNITLVLGYLSDKQYNEYIKNTKYCILNYSELYAMRSSGVIFDSIFMGRPILAKKRKYVEFVKEKNLGVIYNKLDEINIGKILEDKVYENYIASIREYLKNQNKDAERLMCFVKE